MQRERSLDVQETFWSGDTGDDYTKRNAAARKNLRVKLWQEVFETIPDCRSAIEFGCNNGQNLIEIRNLKPDIDIAGVELNSYAVNRVPESVNATLYNQSIFDFEPERNWDLGFYCGVIMHLNPEKLPLAYSVLERSSAKYVLFNENYSKERKPLRYQGRKDLIFTADFAQEFMAIYPNWEIINQGNYYTRKRLFFFLPHNKDIKWFLLARK